MTDGQVGEFIRNMSTTSPIVKPITKRFLIANPREMDQRGNIKVEQLMSWQTYSLI
jgi:hypothetical protein